MTQEPKEKNPPHNESEFEAVEELIANSGKNPPEAFKIVRESETVDAIAANSSKNPPEAFKIVRQSETVEAIFAERGKDPPKGPKDPPQSSNTDNEQTPPQIA